MVPSLGAQLILEFALSVCTYPRPSLTPPHRGQTYAPSLRVPKIDVTHGNRERRRNAMSREVTVHDV